MTGDVKTSGSPDLRARRVAATEAQLVAAATELFLERGYVATTLAAVAQRAELAPRTVYLRFGSKAALFSRVVDRALAGPEFADPRDRPALRQALSGETLLQRIDGLADYAVGIADRTGALFEVAAQAEGVEPALAEAFQSGRREATHLSARIWERARDDGLLDGAALDVEALAALTDLLVCADTTVHLRRIGSWDAAGHRALVVATLTRVAT